MCFFLIYFLFRWARESTEENFHKLDEFAPCQGKPSNEFIYYTKWFLKMQMYDIKDNFVKPKNNNRKGDDDTK